MDKIFGQTKVKKFFVGDEKFFFLSEVRLKATNILVTGDNALYRKRIYLQKNESSHFQAQS